MGLRGEGRRLADAGLQVGRDRQAHQPERHTRRFARLADAISRLEPQTLILDGEVAVYDAQLVSRFEWLRHQSPPELATPPLFMVFDCLQARGKDLRSHPLYVRRNVIENVLDEQNMVLPVRRLADDGLKAWQEVVEKGYEGLVAKAPQSPYVGGRTLKWLKVKQAKYREVERGFYKPSAEWWRPASP